jgi:hypothetical protein
MELPLKRENAGRIEVCEIVDLRCGWRGTGINLGTSLLVLDKHNNLIV